MSETNTTKENGEEGTNSDTAKSSNTQTPPLFSENPSSTPSLLEQAKALKDEIKAENDRREELLAREENLKAKELIAGKTDAGMQPEVPKEETPADYVKKVLSGKV